MTATNPYIPRLSFLFDFDKTLAGDSLNALLGVLGIDREAFDADYIAPLGDGWDKFLRRGHAILTLARDRGITLDEGLFREAALSNPLFPEVCDMPARLRTRAAEVHRGTQVTVGILSSGFIELIAPTAIGRAVDTIAAAAFHFEDGRAVAVRRTITHGEKALHLRAHAEGRSARDTNSPGASADVVAPRDMHVLYDQMCYVGDGVSDLQAFGYLEDRGGLTIAVADGGAFAYEDRQSVTQRVENLAPPDYSDGSELMESLLAAATAGAARIRLRSMGDGE